MSAAEKCPDRFLRDSFQSTYDRIAASDVRSWLDTLPAAVDRQLSSNRWGDYPRWIDALSRLPDATPSVINIDSDTILVGVLDDCPPGSKPQLLNSLKTLCPWRKGPFDLFGIHINAEWRSDWKWSRLKDHIASLRDRTVLDVGSGNGYFCLRMAGAGAELVCGIDPTMLYPLQFQVIQKYAPMPHVNVFPVGIDDMPADFPSFDTVFSMGLLYHRRSPFDHLLHLQSLSRDGGELVLETLVIDGEEGDVLSPKGRYAMMPNVWFIPSCLTLENWMTRIGLKNVRCVNVTKTTPDEQRSTEWMRFQSLSDFLDPNDSKRTIEGYPEPVRAVFIAQT